MDIGANASAEGEDADEGVEDGAIQVNNVGMYILVPLLWRVAIYCLAVCSLSLHHDFRLTM